MSITDSLTCVYVSYILIGNGRSLLFYDIKTVAYQVHSIDLKNDGMMVKMSLS